MAIRLTRGPHAARPKRGGETGPRHVEEVAKSKAPPARRSLHEALLGRLVLAGRETDEAAAGVVAGLLGCAPTVARQVLAGQPDDRARLALIATLVAEARSESGQAERAIAALAAAWRLRSVCRDGLWSVGPAGQVHLAEPSGEVPGELLPPRPVPVGELDAWLAEIRAAAAMLTALASSRPGSVRPHGDPGGVRRAAAGRSARPAEAGRVTGRRGRRKAGRGDAPAS
jgi:hypothetical protein